MKVNVINVFVIFITVFFMSSCVLKKEQTLELDLTEQGCFQIKVVNERSGEIVENGDIMNVSINDLLKVDILPLQDMNTQEYASIYIICFDKEISENLNADELPYSIGIKVPELPTGRYPISITCSLLNKDPNKIYLNKSTFDIFVQIQ